MSNELEDILVSASNTEVVIDFSAAEDFTPPPQAEYPVKVIEVKAGAGVVSKKGDPKIVLTLQVTEGELKGRQFFKHMLLAGKSTGFTRRSLSALGVKADGDKLRLNPQALVGQEALAPIGPQKDQPDNYNVGDLRAKPASAPTI